MIISNKITPSLWFHTNDGKIKHIIEYYKDIFQSNFRNDDIFPLGETPSGYAEMCTFYIFDQPYTAMTTSKLHQPFNDSVSFVLQCENQEEIDMYWQYFTAEGEEAMCGWCSDKFGLRWQIIPNNMAELMQKSDGFVVLSQQRKIIISEY